MEVLVKAGKGHTCKAWMQRTRVVFKNTGCGQG